MSDATTSRAHPQAGFVNVAELPKGPNGRALCRYCNTECPKGRRSFCSDVCVHEWKIRSQPHYARRQVFKRDHGVCAICGQAFVSGKPWAQRPLWEMDHIVPVVEGGGSCGLDNLRTLCVPHHKEATKALAARRALARNPQLNLPITKAE